GRQIPLCDGARATAGFQDAYKPACQSALAQPVAERGGGAFAGSHEKIEPHLPRRPLLRRYPDGAAGWIRDKDGCRTASQSKRARFEFSANPVSRDRAPAQACAVGPQPGDRGVGTTAPVTPSTLSLEAIRS